MRFIPLSFALLASTTLPALSQDSTQALRHALSSMPEMLLANPDAMQVFFLDVPAWRALGDGVVNNEALLRLSIARYIAPLEVLGYGGLESWDDEAGVPLADISYLAGFGMAPIMVSYWGFEDAATASHLIETLKTRNFAPVEGALDGVFGNGEPHQQNLMAREPTNPWVGAFGKSHFVVQQGDAVIQVPTPETLEFLTPLDSSVSDNAIIGAVLDGLSTAIGSSEGQIVQAVVLSPAFGLEAFDPAVILGAHSIADAQAALEDAAQQSLDGVEPYLGGILADVQRNGRPAVTVSLAYSNCVSAEKAVETLEARWTAHMSSEADISGQAVSASDDLCAAVVSFVGKDEGPANPLLRETLESFVARNFNLLQIGMRSQT